MSSEHSTAKGKSETASRSESPVVVPLKHQHSFEERYAAIINQKILENTINKEVLQRQVQAFFPISRSASRECTKDKKLIKEDCDSEEESLDEHRKILQKLETLDIKDKEQT